MESFSIKLLPATLLAVLSTGVFAQEVNTDENVTTLSTVNVKGEEEVKITVERKTRSDLDREMVNDVRDLVRYSPDVGIVDNGRHIKGFAMRGVEGNRVGMSIDGISLPEFEENSLYARYGNFNNSRLSIDPELVTNIDIIKGGNSFELGSGFLGGGVNYRTINASDFVEPGKSIGAIVRSGYASKNREWHNTVGVGYIGEALDVTVLYSHRRGHAMDANGHVIEPSQNRYGNTRQEPDPAKHTFRNYLAKVNYQFNPYHRVGLSVTGQEGSRFTKEYSYALTPSAWRNADDRNKRININAYYQWTPDSDILASAKVDFDYQATTLSALNYKGGRHFITDEPELDNIDNRNMYTKYKRLTLALDSQPLTTGSIVHNLGFRAFVAERDFRNLNKDIIGVGKSWETLDRYTIQYPMKTKQFGLALSNNISWTDKFSTFIGLRYDIEKVEPQELNANCSAACKREGKPAGNIFRNWSGMLGLSYQLNDVWSLAYQVSSGYRVPTASEMYFTYSNAYGTWQSNPNLKAERSLNQAFNIKAVSEVGMLDMNLYHTRYTNFLHEQESLIPNRWGFLTPTQQMVNLDSAKVRGIELKGILNLNKLISAPEGLRLMGSVGYSKGKLSNGTSLLSVQPFKAIIGVDYEDPDERWGLFSRVTYFGAKKAKDAQVTTTYRNRRLWAQDTQAYRYLNKSAWVVDLFGYYRPTKDLTIRAGVYNVFNRQYHTWDALRGINANSTTNSVDRDTRYGLQRYYAPGRNFALAVEYKF